MKCKLFIGILITISFISCNENRIDKKNYSFHDFIYQEYILGPNLDSTSLNVFGECDCCLSDLIFIDSTNFYFYNNCDDHSSYYKGNYIVIKDSLKLVFNTTLVDKYEPIDEIYATDSIIYSTAQFKANEFIYDFRIFSIKEKTCILKGGIVTEFGTIKNADQPKSINKFNKDKKVLELLSQ